MLDVHVGSGGFVVNIDSSTLQLLGLNVGVEPAAADQHVELNLSGETTATIDQFVIVGTDGEAQLAGPSPGCISSCRPTMPTSTSAK